MKKILILFSILFFIIAIRVNAGNLIGSGASEGGGGGGSPFWTETFEGSNQGCDNNPETLISPADPDYQDWKYAGTDSCQNEHDGTRGVIAWAFSGKSELYEVLVFRVTTEGAFSSVNAGSLSIYDSGDGYIGGGEVYKSGSNITVIRAVASGGTTSSGTEVNPGTNYFILIKSVPAAGTIDIWVTTDGDFSGEADESAINGTNSNNAAKIGFKGPAVGGYGDKYAVDNVSLYTTKPSSF